MISSVMFILVNYIFFGIIFYTIFPLLLIWGIWDAHSFQVLPELRLWRDGRWRVQVLFVFLVISQLGVTLFSNQNFWPLMLNDMYARTFAFPPVTEMHFVLHQRGGLTEVMNDDRSFSPFSKFHFSIALLRQKERPDRDLLIETIFAHYKNRLCRKDCDAIVGLSVVRTLQNQKPEIFAAAGDTQNKLMAVQSGMTPIRNSF